jgi:acyl carrier protein
LHGELFSALKFSDNKTYGEIEMEKLIQELKTKIIETLSLLDMTPEDIDTDAQLVGGQTGLDSIDVLELVMMVEKDYGVKIDNKELGMKVFASVRALAQYIHEKHTDTVH